MLNKLIDAHGKDTEIILSFEAGAGVKDVTLNLEQAAKTASVLTEWIAQQVEEEA